MFKKFSRDDVSGLSQVKQSVARAIRGKVEEQMPNLTDHLDDIFPKKSNIFVGKCQTNHLQLILVDGEILFFHEKDGPYMPTLRFVHKYPNALPTVQVDRGAIKFVLSGANIMCPGLTSPGAALPTELDVDQVCIVMAEGKENALAIGKMQMSTKQIREENKGIGIELIHYLNDGLWQHTDLIE